jgi:hypothetical protein
MNTEADQGRKKKTAEEKEDILKKSSRLHLRPNNERYTTERRAQEPKRRGNNDIGIKEP